MRTTTIRHAVAAAVIATVALAAAGCGSATPRPSSAAAGSTATPAGEATSPGPGSSPSSGTAATTPEPAAGPPSAVSPPGPGKPTVPPGPTRPSVPGVSTSTAVVTPLPVDPPRTPVPGVPPGAVTATVGGNGGTVHVALGGTLSLVGFPSNWLPQTSDAAVLSNAPLPVDPVSCQKPPGVPCPLPPLNYKAVAKGTVKLTAHRTQCGEARPCVPPESYDYALTVVVD